MGISNRLARLEKERGAGKVLPILIISHGLTADGLYHADSGATYTEEERIELEKHYQLIIVEYGDWPPGGEVEAWQE